MWVTGAALAVTGCGSSHGPATTDAGKRDAAVDAGPLDAHHDAQQAHDAKTLVDAGTDAGSKDATGQDAFVSDASDDVTLPCQPIDSGSTFGPPACNACLTAACCFEVASCLTRIDGGASPCALLVGCIAACELDGGASPACEASCSEAYPAGIDLAENVNDCLTLHCTADAGSNACGDL
jgi:hypothetical protein